MSGFVLIYSRENGAPISPQVLDSMLSRLAHRGPDGRALLMQPPVALGHQHFWTTPEDLGRPQPLQNFDGRYLIVFDGRLDNRDELENDLGLSYAESRQLCDAAIVLRSYERWGLGCFERLHGPYAAAIYDETARRVVGARDALGDRTLFYYVDRAVLVIASEPHAILAHPMVSSQTDESSLARFFSLQEPAVGQTYFRDVCELPPAHWMVVDSRSLSIQRYWNVDPQPRLRYNSDDEYTDHFRSLLTASIKEQLRAPSCPAIMMSGGLDSTSVAATAARVLGGSSPYRILALSYVFDELTEMDERTFIDMVSVHCGLDSLQIACDNAWPLRDIDTWFRNPNTPACDPFLRISEKIYRAAADQGKRSILTGHNADQMFLGEADWLTDLLAEYRFAEAGQELLAHLQRGSIVQVLASTSIRNVLGRGVRRLFGRSNRAARIEAPPDWLTEHGMAQLPEPDSWPPSARFAVRPVQHRSILGLDLANGITAEIAHARKAGVELRHPYRDRRLLEFMLAIPAHRLYNRGYRKYILRENMRNVLPEPVRAPGFNTSLGSLYNRGVYDRETSVVQEILSSPSALWRQYVRPEWIESTLARHRRSRDQAGPTTDQDWRNEQVIWRCITSQLWHQRRTGLAAGDVN